ncbi:hypothetical protein F4859DRAFT_479180 [Xylaria cf. heliscus]|nr:hypothetical protein F4859DRAFT_479180 [Xylaria cf. heliscus]
MTRFSFTLKNPDRVVDVLFGEATPEQVVPCRRLSGVEFIGELMAMEDFLEGEAYLDGKPLIREQGGRLWCLSLANDPAEVLTSCKTLPRELLVKDVSGTSRQNAYCIANVVTNPQYRNQGLASRLLELVSQWLDGPCNATASILYTSIGDFYVRRGWKKISAHQAALSWPVDFSPTGDRGHLPETRALSRAEIPQLCNPDIRDVEKQIEYMMPQPGESYVCVLPTANLITWLHDRADFMSTKINGSSLQNYGSICESDESWLYWFHDFRKQQLAVQRIREPMEGGISSSALAAMLLDAIEEARLWNLPKVILWEPDTVLLNAISRLEEDFNIKSEIGERLNSSIPSLRWRHADETSETIFLFNEFYTWS